MLGGVFSQRHADYDLDARMTNAELNVVRAKIAELFFRRPAPGNRPSLYLFEASIGLVITTLYVTRSRTRIRTDYEA